MIIGSYLKSAIRSIFSRSIYGPLNIVGLAIGLAASLAVLLWVFSETGYDGFHENSTRIERVGRSRIRNGRLERDGLSAAPVGPALKERFPGVIDYCCTYWDGLKLKSTNASYLANGLFVDPSFFDIFSFKLERGDTRTVLESPTSIVLTEATATRLFADQDPIGEKLDNGLVVTGIVADAPENSSLQFDFLVPNDFLVQRSEMEWDAWYDFGYQTFVLLRDKQVATEIGPLIEDMYKEIDPETRIKLYLQPMLDMHLHNLGGGGRIVYVYLFSVVAVLLLVVACINFVNLATARATHRARELSVRRALGASRWQIGGQIMAETTIQTALALLLAVGLLEITLPHLTDFFGKELSLTASRDTVLLIIGFGLFTSFAAGAYPAFVLSSIRSATALRTRSFTSGPGSVGLVKKALVVFQYVVSATLIFCALVIHSQLKHIHNKDLGIDRDNIVCVSVDKLGADYAAFERELTNQPGIIAATAAFDPPAWCGYSITDFDFDGKEADDIISAGVVWADQNYADVFGLEIVDGRNLSDQYSTDKTDACLINQTAARAMGMDQPVGKSLSLGGRRRTIVGVVKDFHFRSLHSEIGPLIIGQDESWFRRLCIKLSPDSISTGIAAVETTFRKFRPGDDFQIRLLDEYLDRSYRIEQRTGGIILAFTVITAVIASFGLLGLAAAGIEQRTREIGIRKVLGSSVAGIVRLVTFGYLLQILIGSIIAAPLEYYLANRWLEDFAYRVELTWSFFALTTLLALAVALTTISVKSIRAAQANPVDSLRYE